MADNFEGSVFSRAIYPSGFMPYLAMLIGSKFFRSFGIFLSYDLLKLVHIVQFLFLAKAGTALFLVTIQRPFSSGKGLTKNQWFRVCRHAILGTIISLLWLFGLTLCGPLRTLLLFEHGDVVVIAGASALFMQGGTPSRFRGAVFFLIAVMGILLFDHDDLSTHMRLHPDVHRPTGMGNVLNHMFDHLTDLTGLSDHKGGVVLLFATLCMYVGYNSASKKLSLDIGGAKRLHALSTLISAILLLPWVLYIFITRDTQIESWMSLLFIMLLVIIFVFVIDYYIESVSVNHLDSAQTCQIGSMATFVFAILLSCFWTHPFISRLTSIYNLGQIALEDHRMSGGVIFSFILFMFATHILTTSPTRGAKGNFVGYSAAGLPLYSFTGEKIQQASQSVLIIIKNGLRQILEDSDSRKIFYFLCINFCFTFVELAYGAWTNSLGLISDGFHMLFDCSALIMGLYASIMSRWKATRVFSYGYDRVEILSGFINALFLMVIAIFVFAAAIMRIFDPPRIQTEKLLIISVLGLIVNLIGIMAFSHGHSHGGGGHGHAHGGGGGGHAHGGGGGGHAHGGGGGGHGHAHGGQPQGHNTNMQGVFLHVLADTLGSVGVIVSTLLIEQFGWQVADPICSLFIAILIFLSVLPLVKETTLALLLQTPEDIQEQLGVALQKLVAMDGVLSYRREQFWRHSTKVICGTIHVQVRPDVSEQRIVTQVTSLFKELGVGSLAVQVEKETYFQHLSGLGASLDEVYLATSTKSLQQFNKSSYIAAI